MSRARTLDDLARRLAEPMPRRRVLRVLGTSIAAVAFPTVASRVASAATADAAPTCLEGPGNSAHTCLPDGVHQCRCFPSGSQVMKGNCEPGRMCCCTKDPDGSGNVLCIRRSCPAGETWCGGTNDCTVQCCRPPETCVFDGSKYKCRVCDEGKFPCRKTNGTGAAVQCCRTATLIGGQVIDPGERCEAGKCVPCPRRREGCGSTCCKPGQRCSQCIEGGADGVRPPQNGRQKCCAATEKCCQSRCCKKSEQCCGALCCDLVGKNELCAYSRGQRICCPIERMFITSGGVDVCCPVGTVPVKGKGCCPPTDKNCCPPRDNLGGVLNCAGRAQICVDGNCANP